MRQAPIRFLTPFSSPSGNGWRGQWQQRPFAESEVEHGSYHMPLFPEDDRPNSYDVTIDHIAEASADTPTPYNHSTNPPVNTPPAVPTGPGGFSPQEDSQSISGLYGDVAMAGSTALLDHAARDAAFAELADETEPSDESPSAARIVASYVDDQGTLPTQEIPEAIRIEMGNGEHIWIINPDHLTDPPIVSDDGLCPVECDNVGGEGAGPGDGIEGPGGTIRLPLTPREPWNPRAYNCNTASPTTCFHLGFAGDKILELRDSLLEDARGISSWRASNLARQEAAHQQRVEMRSELEAIALGHRGSLTQRELGLDYSELLYGNHDLLRNNDMGRGVFDRLSNETLYHVTGLTRDEAVLPLILGTIRLTGQEILHDDRWYLDHPGRWPFDMAVAEAFNPLNYVGVTGGLILRPTRAIRLGQARPLHASRGTMNTFSSGSGRYLDGPKLSIDDAYRLGREHGIDMRQFKLEYAPGNEYDFGSVGRYFNPKTLEPGDIVRAADGRIELRLFDKGLRSPQDLIETLSHELNHVREFYKTGAFSPESAAEAAAEAARPFIRPR